MPNDKEIYVDEMSIIDGVQMGDGTKVGPFSVIDKEVILGSNCEIQNNVSIANGTQIGNNVFIGSGARLINDKKPVANEPRALSCSGKIVVHDNVSIGANATILCGNNGRPLEIGEHSVIGAGAVITKSVPPRVTVVGNPAGILVEDILGNSFVISFEQYYIKKIK
jgi:UDP-2-acetamido-3-amino-2,3-dideoxy-glucuronate N-acetyltransferase